MIDHIEAASPISRITADLSKAMGAGKDAVILQAIKATGETSITMANIEAFRSRGRFEIHPDKTEVLLWDEKPLIRFYPMEIVSDGGKITASQPYQLL